MTVERIPSFHFNCCTDLKEPDWTTFSHLIIEGCVTDRLSDGSDDEYTLGGQRAVDAEFFTILGALKEGGDYEAITDIGDPRLAMEAGAQLALMSQLSIELSFTLA